MSAPAVPRFSVVVPTFQRCEVVCASVRALARQSFKQFEAIVVVDGSTDGSAEALRSLDLPFSLNVVEQPNLGLSSARNRGAREASGEILLFLDDDMEADPELLAAHDRSHRAGAEIVLGHIPLHPDSPATFLASGVKHWADERARRLARPSAGLTIFDLVCGQVSIRSDLFRVLGGFDESFTRQGTYGNEDLEFGARAIDSGCKTVFNPHAVSYQRYVVGFRAFLDRYRDRARADVELTRKHPMLADAFGVRRHGWIDRLLFKPLATLPFLGEGLTRTCASLGLAIAERNPRSKIAARLFWPGRQMTYWRAVAKSGGFELTRMSAEDSRYNP